MDKKAWYSSATSIELGDIVKGIIALCLAILLLSFCFEVSAAVGRPQLLDVTATALRGNQILIKMRFSAKVAVPSSFQGINPDTLVLDFADAGNGFRQKSKKLSVGMVESYESLEADNKTRVLFRLGNHANYMIYIQANTVLVKIFNPMRSAQVIRPPLGVTQHTQHAITRIDFRRAGNGSGQWIANLSDPNVEIDVSQQGEQTTVNFIDTVIPSAWQRRLDVSDLGTAVRFADVAARGHNVQVVIHTKGPFQQMSYQIDRKFIVDFQGIAANQPNFTVAKTYPGRRLSLNFQNIPIRSVLQILSQFSGVNMVMSDAVTGNITLNLKNVPWDLALDIILQTRSLGERRIEDVLLIAPAEEIASQEKQMLLSRQQINSLESLSSELIQINYGKAKDMAALLKGQGNASLLSSRGNVSVDDRTNILWVQDTPAKITEVKALIRKLDIPVPQVVIETRIVEIDKNYEHDLGVRWGLTKPKAFSATLEGATQMQNGTSPANLAPTINSVPNVLQRLFVDLPAITAAGAAVGAAGGPGSIALALAHLGGHVLLDLELSALESEGNAKIIASPRLITANQQAALIESGEEIPYQEATSSGATSVAFKKAVLSLKVTPQITPDNRVILTLKVNQDKRGAPPVLGVPPIHTREIDTQVLVDNGQTIVLGGIYQKDVNNHITRIPFLGQLPVVGWLFKQKQFTDMQTELLIFVTPKIVKQSRDQQ